VTDEEAPLLVEVRDQRMYLTLNRPRALNAHNQPMRVALVEALDRFEADDDLRVAILKGNGRAFSAGADIKEMDAARASGEYHDTYIHFDRLWKCDKPIIAVVHGYTVGGGFELSQLCDIRVAAADALFGQPEPRNVGGMGGIAIKHLHHLVGRGEASLIHFTGVPITAERAYQIGLVQRLADDVESALKAADEIADQILGCSPTALAHGKRMLRAAVDGQIARDEESQAGLTQARATDEEAAARRAAFINKES
jgi:enoyl-CoA hydratase/carnithine racemase